MSHNAKQTERLSLSEGLAAGEAVEHVQGGCRLIHRNLRGGCVVYSVGRGVEVLEASWVVSNGTV
jgi:hypothetical protein